MNYVPYIITIAISVVLALLLPFALLIIWRVKTRARLLPVLIGAITFVVFVFVLEQLCHAAVFSLPIMTASTPLFVLYAGLAAGVFEETGRWLAFRFVLKKYREPKDAITYGIGHGGIEAILLAGITMAGNLVAAVALASGAAGGALGQGAAALAAAFSTTGPVMFLASGIERVIAVTLHISLSVIVFRGILEKKWGYWLLAVLLHAAVDWYAVLYQRGVITNIWFIELGVFIATVIVALVAVNFYGAIKRLAREAASAQTEGTPSADLSQEPAPADEAPFEPGAPATPADARQEERED